MTETPEALLTDDNKLGIDEFLKNLRIGAGTNQFRILHAIATTDKLLTLQSIDSNLDTDVLVALQPIHESSLVFTDNVDGHTIVEMTQLGEIMHQIIVNGIEYEAGVEPIPVD